MIRKSKYPSTELSTGQRELIARLVGPLEARGISRSTFRTILAEAEFPVPKSSLDRWVHTHLTTGAIFAAQKASGAAPLLDDDQCEIVAGWVLSQNDSNQVVSLASFSAFCKSVMGVDMPRSSAHEYLHALGFSSKVSQVKTSGYTVDVDTLSKMMFDWKRERQRAGDLQGLVASVDFTFTGHRTDRRLSYAPAGGAQPKSSTACSQFTNCIVTVVWSDGVNRTPPALFTFNGKFRFDRVGRKAWDQERDKLEAALVRYGIEAKRVMSSLSLLSHLDADLKAHSATWFKRNILSLTAESARELIRGRSGQRSQVDYDRLYAYRNFVGLDVKVGPDEGAA